MKGALYPKIFDNLLNGTVSLVDDTVKAALMKTEFSFNEAHEDWDDTHEIEDTDYTPGGETLAITAAQIDVTNRVITISTTSTVTEFTALGDITAFYCVLYITDGEATPEEKLLACFDFEGEESSEGAEFEINWGLDGGSAGELFTIETAAMPG